MKLNFKFNATKVDEIEQARKLPIENCVGDSSISSICLFVQKGLVNDESGTVGCSKSVAMDTIDKYLETNEKTELMLDIMEALCDGGFLSRELDIENLRQVKKKREKQVKEMVSNEL
jgi:hypothetical protein